MYDYIDYIKGIPTFFFVQSSSCLLLNLILPSTHPPSPPPPPPKFYYHIWILCKKNILSPPPPPRQKNICLFFQILILCQFVKNSLAPTPPSPHYPITPPPTPTHTQKKKKNYYSDLGSQNSITRWLKIRLVGFVLKKLLTYIKMLIVPHVNLGNCVEYHTVSILIFFIGYHYLYFMVQ